MARYSKVDRKVWTDDKFAHLSRPAPCGRYLWFWLLTNPLLTSIPGVFNCGEAGMAEALEWDHDMEGFRIAFREVLREGMVEADWKSRLVWVPKAWKYNAPESPNVVRSWRIAWDEIPECALKLKAWHTLKAFTEGLGEGFAKAFLEVCPQPRVRGGGHPSPNPEPEPEPEQVQDQEHLNLQPQKKNLPATSQKREAGRNGHSKKVVELEPKPTVLAWNAYAAAYRKRYTVDPVRNAKTNALVAQLVGRIGADDAPHVAAFYVSHQDKFYCQRGHSLDILVRDAEKLRTEWFKERGTLDDPKARAKRDLDMRLRRAWGDVEAALRINARNVPSEDPIVSRAVERIGGISTLQRLPPRERSDKAQAFLQAYRAIDAEQEQQRGAH